MLHTPAPATVIWSRPPPPPPKPVEQLWLPLEKLTPLLAALKAAKLVLQACASA